MGDFNASKTPDLPRAQVMTRNYNFLDNIPVRTEEWDLDSANRVSAYRDGANRLRVKIKNDPRAVPLT